MNECAQCRVLRDACENATIKYMRYLSGNYDEDEAQRLFKSMKAARNALQTHQQYHASRN